MLEKFLWPHVEVHPHTRSNYLSLAEFATNNAVNASTGYSPFVLNVGETLTLPESLVVSQGSSMNQVVADALSTKKKLLEIAHDM